MATEEFLDGLISVSVAVSVAEVSGILSELWQTFPTGALCQLCTGVVVLLQRLLKVENP